MKKHLSVLAGLLCAASAIAAPGSWSVYDVFQAAAALLRGETSYLPTKAYGFLARPQGVKVATRIRAADLRVAAAKLPRTGFVPPEIDVGGTKIGSADFLFAALEVLTTGADEVTAEPREQLGSYRNCPSLEHVNIKDGRIIHSPDLNGKLLDERLKLQLWTLRFE